MNSRPNTRRHRALGVFSALCAVLVVAFVAVALLSWLLTAAMPELRIRSLLSTEGIRRMLVNLVDAPMQPPLIWILLWGAAWGVIRGKRGNERDNPRATATFRRRLAWQLVAAEAFVFVVLLALLILPRDAVLLSATGRLFPSSFSYSIIPMLAISAIVFAATWHAVVGHISSLGDLWRSLAGGIASAAPIVVLWLLATWFIAAVRFVLS